MVAHFIMRTCGVNQAFWFVEGIWLQRKSRNMFRATILYKYHGAEVDPHYLLCLYSVYSVFAPPNLSTLSLSVSVLPFLLVKNYFIKFWIKTLDKFVITNRDICLALGSLHYVDTITRYLQLADEYICTCTALSVRWLNPQCTFKKTI